MIVSRIFGGLGNQLFQYAAGYALASHHNVSFKLDISEFPNYSLRSFELEKLIKPLHILAPEYVIRYKPKSKTGRIIQRFLPYKLKTFYKEPFFHFDPDFLKLSNNVYLQGYFQSEAYFSSIKDQIRLQIDLSNLVSDEIKRVGAVIKSNPNSVSIHIRRGDYGSAVALKVHGLLDRSYYMHAINYFKERFTELNFFLFSDAPEIASNELNFLKANLVSGEISKDQFSDLYLMSCCNHNIIANSSFSWWAAWLNNNPRKIVIAPDRWFNSGPKDTQDLLPENWIRL